ncbi:MAG: hypothetical protein FJY95_14395 [Candidatus Handelsmanbacteria bacterium]|nr:hypothetical protein [Candidatus Handelsmanbacteria bacterium]
MAFDTGLVKGGQFVDPYSRGQQQAGLLPGFDGYIVRRRRFLAGTSGYDHIGVAGIQQHQSGTTLGLFGAGAGKG